MSADAVTDAGWDTDVLGAAELVIVAVCSRTGRPCRDFRPVLDELAVKVLSEARVVVIDVDDNPAVARRYDVTSVPTMLVFRHGGLAGRLVGGRTTDRLLAELSPYLRS